MFKRIYHGFFGTFALFGAMSIITGSLTAGAGLTVILLLAIYCGYVALR